MTGSWSERVGAFSELSRLSNLPTVLSNALVGAVLGVAAGAALEWGRVALVMTGVSLFYVGGMALNDLVDREVDAIDRPGRPIPSGRISPGQATIFVLLTFATGLVSLAPMGWPALLFGVALVGAIVLYDWSHRAFSGAVALMGLCRALVYAVACAAIAWPIDDPVSLAVIAGAMWAYITALTVIARFEARPQVDWTRWGGLILPPLGLLPLIVLRPESWFVTSVFAVAATVGVLRGVWFSTRTPARPVHAVMAWLASIALFDGMYLAALDRTDLTLVTAALFAVTLAGHRRILGS
ncbi:MAG: UbiA family prenyltransferase [Phycisphaerales bacterium]